MAGMHVTSERTISQIAGISYDREWTKFYVPVFNVPTWACVPVAWDIHWVHPFLKFIISALGRTKVTDVSAEQALECLSFAFHNPLAAILTRALVSTLTENIKSSKLLILLHAFVAAVDPKVSAAKFETFNFLEYIIDGSWNCHRWRLSAGVTFQGLYIAAC